MVKVSEGPLTPATVTLTGIAPCAGRPRYAVQQDLRADTGDHAESRALNRDLAARWDLRPPAV
jgi:hypothetical protein